MHYALVIGKTVDLTEEKFWTLTPKTIQKYFKAYREQRKVVVQDLWLGGYYQKMAIVSSFAFDKNKQPPKYPEMPFKDEEEKELANNEEWLAIQRKRAFDHFTAILCKNKK